MRSRSSLNWAPGLRPPLIVGATPGRDADFMAFLDRCAQADPLGSGRFGRVYAALHPESGEELKTIGFYGDVLTKVVPESLTGWALLAYVNFRTGTEGFAEQFQKATAAKTKNPYARYLAASVVQAMGLGDCSDLSFENCVSKMVSVFP